MRLGVMLAALLSGIPAARGAEPEPYHEPVIEVHGFASPGFILTTPGTNYLAKSQSGSAEFSEVGINFSKQLGDNLRFGLQLFARDLGKLGTYSAKLDWFYVDYRFADWLGFRAGRVKVPVGLYNETSDIDAARVPVLLPQSIYPIQNRDFLLAQTGAELYGYLTLGDAGALDYRAFAGTVYLPTPTVSSTSPFQDVTVAVPFVTGGRLIWETPLAGLRVGASILAGHVDYGATVVAGPTPSTITLKLDSVLWVASAELAADPLTVAAEYGRWTSDSQSSDESLVPGRKTTSERAYVSVAYRVAPWFHPSIYYALLFPDTRDRSGREHQQHDVALTLRFDVDPHWLWKLEAHYMVGTAALDSALNGGKALADLPNTWGLFLVKTTAYF